VYQTPDYKGNILLRTAEFQEETKAAEFEKALCLVGLAFEVHIIEGEN
jgi:hypothetical protein